MESRWLWRVVLILALMVPTPVVVLAAESCAFPLTQEASHTRGGGAVYDRELFIADLVGRADVVLQGRVRDWSTYQGPRDIQTDVLFDIDQVVAGTWQARQATITVPGGRLGNLQLSVGETPEFVRGQQMLLFTQRASTTSFRLIDNFVGALHVAPDCSVPAAGGIGLDELRSRTQDAANGRLAPQRNSRVEVLSDPHPSFVQTNAAIWRSTLSYSANPSASKPGVLQDADVVSAWTQGYNTWDVETTGFSSSYLGTTSRTARAVDFNNDILWDASYDAASNILAQAFSAFSVVSGQPFERLDADIMYNNKKTWAVDGISNSDIATVAIHESGHTVGFSHEEADALSVMRSIYQGVRRSLSAQDLVGMLTLYPTAGGPTNTPTRTVTPSNTATPTATLSPSPTSPPPTATFTFTRTRTLTPVPPTATLTPVPSTATPSSTPVPPTVTFTASPTPVPPTPTSTPSLTSVPPTATSTPSLTSVPATATSSATLVPPTATFTLTPTPVPPTATSTLSPTLLPSTLTFTSTATAIPPTQTSAPSSTVVPPTATSTASPTATTTPSGAVLVQSVYTDDGVGVSKTSYLRGDPIRYVGLVTNQNGVAATAEFIWHVDGPGGVLEHAESLIATDPGLVGWGITRSIPLAVAFGTYTYRLTVNFNGTSSSQQVTFQVPDPSTPTHSPTPLVSATSTRTSTITPTATASASPSVTPTSTVAPSPLGGRAFSLRAGPPGSAVTTWEDGTTETGYIVIRWSPVQGTVFFPPNLVPYPANASGFTDTSALVDEAYCYLVMPVGGNPSSVNNFLGFSDFLCVYAAPAVGNVPSNFTVRLNQGNLATLTWGAPGGQTAYQLVVNRFDGSPEQTLAVAGGALATTNDTGGASACYQLRAMNGASVLGTSPKVCAVPGITTLGAAGAANRSTGPGPSLEGVMRQLEGTSNIRLPVRQ